MPNYKGTVKLSCYIDFTGLEASDKETAERWMEDHVSESIAILDEGQEFTTSIAFGHDPLFVVDCEEEVA